jgi:hypothetical protein
VEDRSIIGPPNTRIYADGRHTVVIYWDRPIVQVAYWDIMLDAEGDRDTGLQNRLNQTSRLFDLGYHITRREGFWIVQTKFDHYVFRDKMHIKRSLGGVHEYITQE